MGLFYFILGISSLAVACTVAYISEQQQQTNLILTRIAEALEKEKK